MVKIIFTCDVPKERQEEFIEFSRKNTKVYWEAHGCLSYDLWQTNEGSPIFFKEMLFEDAAGAQKALSATDPEAKALVERWRSFTVDLTRKIYELKT